MIKNSKKDLSDLIEGDVFLMNYDDDQSNFDIVASVVKIKEEEESMVVTDLLILDPKEDLDYEYEIIIKNNENFTFKEFHFNSNIMEKLKQTNPEYFV